jgi:hypothetical protein
MYQLQSHEIKRWLYLGSGPSSVRGLFLEELAASESFDGIVEYPERCELKNTVGESEGPDRFVLPL